MHCSLNFFGAAVNDHAPIVQPAKDGALEELLPGFQRKVDGCCDSPVEDMPRVVGIQVQADVVSADVDDVELAFVFDGFKHRQVVRVDAVEEHLLAEPVCFSALCGVVNAVRTGLQAGDGKLSQALRDGPQADVDGFRV